jgi:septal ring factor EnvC (AmiA/AmiB activator)
MATTAWQKLKAFLAAGEVVMRTGSDLDEKWAELAAVDTLLPDRRNELAETERQISENKEEITRTGAALRQEQQRLAAAQGKSNEEIGKLEARIKELNAMIKEREAKAANVLAGLKALHERISGEQRSE